MSTVQLRLAAALAALVTALPAAHAAELGQDLKVQPPTLVPPQRGSLAGSLSQLSFGAADLARGAYSLPLDIETPEARGKLLAQIFPAYSAEGGLSEWGMGWKAELAIQRARVLGDLQYDDTDGFVSPWGRLVQGDDGAYYPAGLGSQVRLVRAASGWQANLGDGTIYTFAAADAVTTPDGTFAWMLSRVDSLHGDSTHLSWLRNASGRSFLQSVRWGGRHDGTQYEAQLGYETVARPFTSYGSGSPLVLDRRVVQVVVKARAGAALSERWHYDLGYTTSPLGPAFYLTSAKRTFASGASEPVALYDYDLGIEHLQAARLEAVPALDTYLMLSNGLGLQTNKSATIDIEQNGLTDLEHSYAGALVRYTGSGFTLEALPARTGLEDPRCRPADSIANEPRALARMLPGAVDPHVVVVRPDSGAFASTVTICSRAGMALGSTPLPGSWRLDATTRMTDVDSDQRPDLVRFYGNGVQVSRNTSTATSWSFQTLPGQPLEPAVSGATVWVLDVNGDGKPDLTARSSSAFVVWYGKGHGRFESVGKILPLRQLDGSSVVDLAGFQFSHGDFNGDGLSDVLLSKGQRAYTFLNQGDHYAQAAVPGLANLPFSFSYPVFADLRGSGNPELVFVDGRHAKSIALATPSTGLLRRADDGKGTVIQLGYSRVRPEPGITHRYALLSSLTVASTGQGSVTYSYEYGKAIWHSVGRYLVGFASATKLSPRLSERVDFWNDDDVSGVVLATVDRDSTTPAIERFTTSTLEAVRFRGLDWRRPRGTESGYRPAAGGAALSTRVDFETWQDLCPLRVRSTLPGVIVTKEETLAAVPALVGELHCLPATQRMWGVHDDATRNFDHRLDITRDELGQVTRVAQLGPMGTWIMQENSYQADGRLATSGAPGRGLTRLGYDALGRLTQVVAVDGSITRVAAIDPVTDALRELADDRGGAVSTQGFGYDGLGRLASVWGNVAGTTPAQPSQQLAYRYASAEKPGAIDVRTAVDVAAGRSRREVELQAASGDKLATARWTGAWLIDGLAGNDRASLTKRGYDRAPVAGSEGILEATLAGLYATDVRELETTVGAGFGFTALQTTQHEEAAAGTRSSSWELRGAELVERTVANGTFVREVARDAAGQIVRHRDELGVEHRYGYDGMGRLVHVTTPDGVHRLSYDAYGRTTRIVRSGVATVDLAYHPTSGLLVEKRYADAGGQLVRRELTSYDAIGRQTGLGMRRADGAARELGLQYDGEGLGAGGSRLPGQLGRLSVIRAEQLERRLQHDAAGRLVQLVARLGNGWRELTRDMTYFADGAPRTTVFTVRDQSGAVLETRRLTTEVDEYGRVARALLDGAELYRLSRDGRGRLATAHLADGHVLTAEYDPVTAKRRGFALSGPVVSSGVAWRLDARGLVASERFTRAGSARTRTYGYGGRGELTTASDGSASTSYTYTSSGLPLDIRDDLGQRRVRPSGSTLDVGGVAYRWDAAGRVVRRGDTSFEYGPGGELDVARRGARTVRYFYDEANLRALKTVDGIPVRADVEGAVLTAAGLVLPVEIDGITVGVIDAGRFRTIATDARGTPISDEAGAEHLGSPYGARTTRGARAETLDFTRLGYDADLGSVRMGARDYDPTLSQFWTPDPLFLENLEKCQGSPLECNLYGYAKGNPLSFVDPRGTQSVEWKTESGKAEALIQHADTIKSTASVKWLDNKIDLVSNKLSLTLLKAEVSTVAWMLVGPSAADQRRAGDMIGMGLEPQPPTFTLELKGFGTYAEAGIGGDGPQVGAGIRALSIEAKLYQCAGICVGGSLELGVKAEYGISGTTIKAPGVSASVTMGIDWYAVSIWRRDFLQYMFGDYGQYF